ncbi:MAG: hypothetical protein CMD25_04815 [Flavobacteriales bacterium]|nr:hypothetical protein [Flavobacteriales bacterium]|tara:strand:+ start:6377 stop:7423 length:1047 start_codon:yes stop_codon:yes gene_type:complete
MFGTRFYNETIKRAVSIFGTLFNNIDIADIKTDGTVLSIKKVPISYGPKAKFLARLQNETSLNDGNRTAISLPRIAFELTGFEYDQTRQQNKLFRNTKTTQETDKVNRKFQYAPAPYNLNFTLSVMANKMNDALQIVEQILPYFQPDYTVTMKMIDDMSDNRDVPVILNSVSFEDTYQGGFDERRVITYDLEFQMQLYFFGPVYQGKIIKNVIERDYIGDGNAGFTTSEITNAGLVKEVKHYEPAFENRTNTAVSDSSTIAFGTALDADISVGDEVFGTNLTTNPTISSIANDRLSVVVSANVTIDANTRLKFVGSVDTNDTFVVAETVSFYDDGTDNTYADNLIDDA